MKQKISYAVATLLEIAFVVAAYIFYYYQPKKLGMMRFLNYWNNKLNKKLPMEVIMIAAVVIIVLLILLVIINYRKKRTATSKMLLVPVAVMTVMGLATVAFITMMSAKSILSYYFMSGFFLLAVVLQAVKTLLAMRNVTRGVA